MNLQDRKKQASDRAAQIREFREAVFTAASEEARTFSRSARIRAFCKALLALREA
jgi:hypothetical protein